MRVSEAFRGRTRSNEVDFAAVFDEHQVGFGSGKSMASIRERVHSFSGETLSHRARGQPKTMLDAKELREFLVYTSLRLDF